MRHNALGGAAHELKNIVRELGASRWLVSYLHSFV